MLHQVSVAAATAVVDYDLLRDAAVRSSPFPRVLKRAGLTGSAAAGDTKVVIKAGQTTLAELFNRTTGFPSSADDNYEVNGYIGPNEELRAIVTDAPLTNAINLVVDVVP